MSLGCGDRKDAFLGARVEDRCDESWPVCDVVAGCVLGPESYREGNFPGEGRFIVRVAEPSIVKVSFFLEDATAAGEETVIVWNEDGCRGRVREAITGRTFLAEAERMDGVTREAQLNGVGDHLIEYASDAQARYVVKVDVVPKRNAE